VKLIDMKGRQCGKWEVLSYAGDGNWNCRCECGTERPVAGVNLRDGWSQDCGCGRKETLRQRNQTKVQKEKVVHGLTGKPKSPKHCENISKAAKIRNNQPEYHAMLVENGKKGAAGLVERNKQRAYSPEETKERSLEDLFRSYRGDAALRGLTWQLSRADFDVLVFGYCHYCGQEPRQERKFLINGGIIYNGIDRVANELGYFFANCVSCCGRCNWWKGQLSKQEFLEHASKIASHAQTMKAGA